MPLCSLFGGVSRGVDSLVEVWRGWHNNAPKALVRGVVEATDKKLCRSDSMFTLFYYLCALYILANYEFLG